MTKEAYFEMCELLGNDPIDSEVPIEISDFPSEIQQCFTIYGTLSDIWDSTSGTYSGKDYSNLFDYFELFEIETIPAKMFALNTLKQIDSCRSAVISEKVRVRQANASKG